MRAVALLVFAGLVACGSSTAPAGDSSITGQWDGQVGAVGSRQAAAIHLLVLPNGNGSYDGLGVVAFGKDSNIYIGLIVSPAGDSLAMTLYNGTSDTGKAPVLSIAGRRVGVLLDSHISGGAFVNDQLTLSHTP